MSQFIEMYHGTKVTKPLESICDYLGKGITPKYVDDSTAVVINQACVYWDGLHLENVKYHNVDVPIKKRLLESGDILLNATGNGTLGRSCVFICPSVDSIYVNDGHVIAISADKSIILPEVINAYFSLKDTQDEIYRQYVTGSTNQIDIVFTDLKKMSIPVPDMDKQIEFVDILKQADKSKFSDFKSQFIEMFGNANQPKYEVRKLGDVCEVARGGSPRPIANFVTDDPNGINWIKIGDADGSRYINKTAEKIKSEGVKKSRMVYKGDLILSNSMSFGHPYILNIEGCIHDGWLVLHFDKDIFDPMYLQAYLEQPYTYLLMSNLAAGGVVNNLNSEVVKTLPIIVPSIEIQREYVSILNQADKSKYYGLLVIDNLKNTLGYLIKQVA